MVRGLSSLSDEITGRVYKTLSDALKQGDYYNYTLPESNVITRATCEESILEIYDLVLEEVMGYIRKQKTQVKKKVPVKRSYSYDNLKAGDTLIDSDVSMTAIMVIDDVAPDQVHVNSVFWSKWLMREEVEPDLLSGNLGVFPDVNSDTFIGNFTPSPQNIYDKNWLLKKMGYRDSLNSDDQRSRKPNSIRRAPIVFTAEWVAPDGTIVPEGTEGWVLSNVDGKATIDIEGLFPSGRWTVESLEIDQFTTVRSRVVRSDIQVGDKVVILASFAIYDETNNIVGRTSNGDTGVVTEIIPIGENLMYWVQLDNGGSIKVESKLWNGMGDTDFIVPMRKIPNGKRRLGRGNLYDEYVKRSNQ